VTVPKADPDRGVEGSVSRIRSTVLSSCSERCFSLLNSPNMARNQEKAFVRYSATIIPYSKSQQLIDSVLLFLFWFSGHAQSLLEGQVR
jgi:hypothetical protein